MFKVSISSVASAAGGAASVTRMVYLLVVRLSGAVTVMVNVVPDGN